MDNDQKIEKWIKEMESEGRTRDDIARGMFVTKKTDGTFTVYKLTKAGKKKYNLGIHIGAIDLDELYEN